MKVELCLFLTVNVGNTIYQQEGVSTYLKRLVVILVSVVTINWTIFQAIWHKFLPRKEQE